MRDEYCYYVITPYVAAAVHRCFARFAGDECRGAFGDEVAHFSFPLDAATVPAAADVLAIPTGCGGAVF